MGLSKHPKKLWVRKMKLEYSIQPNLSNVKESQGNPSVGFVSTSNVVKLLAWYSPALMYRAYNTHLGAGPWSKGKTVAKSSVGNAYFLFVSIPSK